MGSVDAELRYTAETPIPDVSGHLDAEGIRVEKFRFARAIQSDFSGPAQHRHEPADARRIADGVAELRDVEVQPLAKGIPIKAASSTPPG